MSVVSTGGASRTTLSDLRRELDRASSLPPSDVDWYRPRPLPLPLRWTDDDPLWWPRSSLRPMDDLVARRLRNQMIRIADDWAWPLRWSDSYPGERVHVDQQGFRVDIDVRQFRPHEIVVKTTDDCVIVEGNHERRSDGHSLVERHFVRKYLLPRGFNANDVISNLSNDGLLTIKAPPPPPLRYYSPHERLVRIHETGKSAAALPWK